MFTRLRWKWNCLISRVKIYPYYSYEFAYYPTWPTLDPHRIYRIQMGATIGEVKRMPRQRRLVADQWDQFAREVLPPSVSAAQRSDMRHAFYAGAISLLALMDLFTDVEKPNAEDDRLMRDLDRELSEYSDDISKRASR